MLNTIDYSYDNWEPEILKDDLGSEIDAIIKRINTDVQSLVYTFNNVIGEYNNVVSRFNSGNDTLHALKVYDGNYHYQSYNEKLEKLKVQPEPIDKVVEDSFMTIDN